MNFELTEEQQMLQDSVARFVQDNYELEARTTLAATKEGFSADHWKTMAELGWLGMPFSEADGGFGGNQIDTMVMMEQMGKGLVLEPFYASVVLGGGVVRRAASAEQKAAILPGVMGAICLLLALYALQMLPVNYAGLALILLGIILMIAEVLAPSFGVLGFGGIIAMVIGSIILIDTDVPGFQVSRALIGSIAMVGSLGLMAIIWFAVRARQRPVVSGREQLIGATGTALAGFEREGEVFVHSERWRAVTDAPLLPHQLKRLARRVGLGLARSGAVSHNGSGDIFLAFSTANGAALSLHRTEGDAHFLANAAMNPLFTAVVEAADEAVLQSREYGVRVADSGYAFYGLEGEAWVVLSGDKRLRERSLPDFMEPEVTIEGLRIVLDETPLAAKPQIMMLSSGELMPDFAILLRDRETDRAYRIGPTDESRIAMRLERN